MDPVSSWLWDLGGPGFDSPLLVALVYCMLFGAAMGTFLLYGQLRRRLEAPPPARPLPPDWRPPGYEPPAPEPAPPALLTDYLDRLRSNLNLPDGMESDVAAEIKDHIDDSRTALEAEGMEPDAAIREALARLGSVTDLAEHIRRAHQTTRRMLAGAAGGVFLMPGAYVASYVVGSLILFAASVVAQQVFAATSSTSYQLLTFELTHLAGMGALSVVSFYTARTGVRVSAAISRRPPTALGGYWALMGTPFVAVAVLFGIHTRQSWPMFGAELTVPIAFAAGSLYRVSRPELRMPFIEGKGRSLIAAAGATLVLGLVMGLVLLPLGASVRADSFNSNLPVENIDRAGPLPAAALMPPSPPGLQVLDPVCYVDYYASDPGVIYCSFFGTGDKSFFTQWTDLRLEVWRGVMDDTGWHGGIEDGSHAPSVVGPATEEVTDADNPNVVGTIDVGMRRDGPIWWVVLTGKGPDGTRYRLSNGRGVKIDFVGTGWDWLTAPG